MLPVIRQKGLWESFFHTLLALPFQIPGCGLHTGKMTLILAELGDNALGCQIRAFPRCQSVSYTVIFKNSGPQIPENTHLQTHCSTAHMR